MLQTFPRALARHLHQAKRRHRRDVILRVIAHQRLAERLQHLAAMLFFLHVDEVDDDDAAKIAQAQLAGDGDGRLEVGAEDRFFERAMTDIGAGVDVDRGHRFRLIENQIAARLQRHLAIERFLNLLLDAIQIEDRPVAAIQLNAAGEFRHEHLREVGHALISLRMIDADLVHAAGHHIA